MKLQRNGRTKALAIGALAVVSSLTLAACGSDNNNASSTGGSSSSSTTTASAADCGSGQVLGAGSTAQQNAMQIWIRNFQQQCSGVTINYQGTGSTAGRTTWLEGKTQFAGSDSAMKAADIAKSSSVCGGTGHAINLPMVGGPIAIAYNLPGVSNLVLDAPTLAKIFSGKITTWNDPAIKALNPSASLPSTPIQTFHRSDGSGTSANFSAYLAAAAPSDWSYGSNSQWPAPGGQAAQGSSGLAAQVKQVTGSISYFELSYAKANNATTASISTGSGTPVAVSTDAAAKAISEATVVGTNGDLALKLNYATKTAGAYPISLVTYEIVCNKGNAAATLPALKSFLNYTISDAGQQAAAPAGYLQLPSAITDKVKAAISTLS
ncbi:phosphate ABC transporter substrate-binding protein PstS [Streptacidiphilus fuscans]|uniref:Phosphate-binding protein n=1 Tax=Streptacidiphilus fuscans TaxID=2789292 RepID=A0A931FHX7_9ACTN|nr:phosphate ABC transporter substrate-binding protein PstS [Streptacidiphilus fuscans]MBF9072306.1 phosphate ABC transporter substrate-binding protein PstS [Streptacidiphilus fuscans]